MPVMTRRVTVWFAVLLSALLLTGLLWLFLNHRSGREVPERAILVKGGEVMTVVKVLELVGESKTDWQDAVQNAVAEASATVDGITGVEVYNLTANVENGKVVEYKANVKVAFAVDPSRRNMKS